MEEIVNEHLDVRNIDELGYYLDSRVGDYENFGITYMEDGRLDGFWDNAEFTITYEQGKRMRIQYPVKSKLVGERLYKTLAPLMWYKDSAANKDVPFAPILEYTDDGDHIIEWEYMHPFDRVAGLFFALKKRDLNLTDVDIKLNISDEKLLDMIKYGNYTGCFQYEELEEIKNFKEYQLYLKQQETLGHMYTIFDEKIEDPDITPADIYDYYSYRLSYLMTQTKKFGIPIGEPNLDTAVAPSVEFEAWTSWWSDAMDKFQEEHQNMTVDEYLKITHKTDFKPQGSYRDYIDSSIRRIREMAEVAGPDINKIVDDYYARLAGEKNKD